MGAGVAGVEAFDLVLLGGASAAGAAHDDGNIAGGVVLHEIGLLRGLTGGDDCELGIAICCSNDAGVEVLGGIEVEDLRRLPVANAGVAVRCVLYGCNGSDAGLASEERLAKGRNGGADGGDAAEACDDDTIHFERGLLGVRTRLWWWEVPSLLLP